MKDLADRIEAAIRSSPMCRDCADFGPRCPNSGELCDSKESAKELSDMVRTSIPISKIEEFIKENKRSNTPKSYKNVVVRIPLLEALQKLIDKAKQ